ncbi:type I polyketide synthase [Fischerella thermalis]|uniref:type I polyketide synthase n=1 Tax=Fischerella thermalis TaxID=372787 RepID=UPI000C80FAB9|nr:type I polyketide synthase [Fischerella thermalis]PLZ13185.1 polyketide synthase [Fischerella thermalis WC119]PLZ14172.1 polyketide synthase [Fischerella thermalis WC114]PLZ20231.1 polyketide synthase [Fischerella thermalis WC157]PLZ61027.1 polyketide synthase [Fischerella thermalis WC344]PLZ65250.1 polyketide synthase [Fischerella thermalis WC249]
MSAHSIEIALAQLEEQINNCEKAVTRFVEVKKRMSDNSMGIEKMNRKLQYNPIAIIGMASLFPQAKNLREYWQNIVNKLDCITDIPPTHWSVEDYYDPNPRTPEDKTYCKRGGFLPHVDFNPMDFGIPPNILEVTDVSQLLSLLVAKQAMEDAGYGESREFNRETVGVILGSAALKLGIPLSARLQYPIWKKALKSSGLSDEDTQKIIEKIKSAYVKWDENAFPGMLANVISGRIANRLNLGGINCTVDAACASSFAALKMAISELVEHRCDMMLTGGVDTDNSITAYISFSKTPAVTPSETVRPFDAQSDGMMLGEGIGIVVLKRLEDAVRDNDKIYAVIKGIGTSSDGRYKSIYAPRQEGQVQALRRAYEDAGFPPETVGLIEAHGTGTMAGDPTEFSSLREFFTENNSKRHHIALGTVKSQIGHTKAAAGAASLIKTALALHHKILPATINVTEPNPKLNIKNSPFYLNTETRPWIRSEGEAPRRAGVSSFGFGGTNYHVVLEEYEGEHNQAYRLHAAPSEIVLFAQTPAELLSSCQETLAQLQSEAGNKNYVELVEACKTKEIPQGAARVGFVAENSAEACKLLQISIDLLKNKPTATSWEHPQGVYYRAYGMELAGKVVALFSGQGSQYLNMGRELVMNFPEMRNLYGYMDSLLRKDNLQPLSEIVFPHPVFEETEKNAQVAALQKTQYAQPAIGMLSAGMYKILQQSGFKADFVAGHSFGELTALWAAGVLSDADYCFLVKARGQAMAAPQDPNYDTGAMLAVKEDLSKVEAVIRNYPQVAIANFNSPCQVVLAGPTNAITQVKDALHKQGYAAVSLPVSAAFHTPLIAFAQKSFAIAIKNVTFQIPQIPVYTNVTGKEYPKEPALIQKTLETHLSNSVLFKQEIENIYAAGGYCFVEFGPRNILTNLIKDILGDRPHMAIALNPSAQKNSDHSLREAAVQLRVAGMSLKNLDPYQLPPVIAEPPKNKGLNVKLCGSNYVSDKTKMAFEQALHNGQTVKLQPSETTITVNSTPVATPAIALPQTNGTNGHSKQTHSVKDTVQMVQGKEIKSNGNSQSLIPTSHTPHLPIPEFPAPHSPMQSEIPDKLVNYQRVLESLEYVLTQFQQNQSENLQVHSHYLSHQVEYAKTFFQLMQQQNSLLANGKHSADAAKLKPSIIESLDRSMMQFHAQQGETLRIHEQYLKEQVEYTKNFFQLVQQEYSQLINEGATTQPVISTNGKIGTPEEVKIIKEVTQVTEVKPVKETTQENTSLSSPTPPTSATPTVSTPSATPAPTIDLSDLDQTLLAITSEKTGYPIEMLELDMDMEADLGIDSIKRVEIMGALQEKYPDLPKPSNVEELAELRTIGQIVQYLQSLVFTPASVEDKKDKGNNIESIFTPHLPTSPSPTPDLSSGVPEFSNDSTAVSESVAVAAEPIITVTETATSTAEVDLSNLAETLLAITSEKTGYPVEMLELDMDMEADLGIDSIKRVEIMGALQEKYPDLPKPSNVEELAELRTIGQIVEYLQKLAGAEKKKQQHESVNQLDESVPNVQRRPAKLQILPPPDFWEFPIPEGHIALITDDGSLTTTKVAELLNQRGWKVVVLKLPPSLVPEKSPLPAGVNRVTLQDATEEHLQQQLAAIATHYGNVGAFIHIHPVFQANHNSSVAYFPEEKAIIKQVFFIAKHLKKSLNAAANHGRSCFCTVARLDGAFGVEHKVNFGAIGAGLFGLTKTMIWEWPKVYCRAIDLSPDFSAETSAQYIVAELHDPNRYLTEVAYGSQGRVTLVSVPDR